MKQGPSKPEEVVQAKCPKNLRPFKGKTLLIGIDEPLALTDLFDGRVARC